jgi:hypothetical protein
LKETLNYNSPDIVEVSKCINNISSSTKELEKDETLNYKTNNEEIVLHNNSELIDISEIEDHVTEETLSSESVVIYKVNKPDFLGETQWSFKHGTRNINAKITDKKWLEDFQQGIQIVTPGDSLKVKDKICCKYNKHGSLISQTHEIVEVIEIIKKQKVEMLKLELYENQ